MRRARLAVGLALVLAAPLAGPAPTHADEQPAIPSAALDAAARHGVMVAFRFQKDLEAEATGATAPDPDAATEVFRRWRMSLRVPGFVVRDRRTILVSDVFVSPGAMVWVGRRVSVWKTSLPGTYLATDSKACPGIGI